MHPRPRRYADACAAAHALELVGDRWALLVMRELLLGPRRFGDLRASLPGISATVLIQRLEELEAVGIVVRRKLAPPAAVQVYALTEWGLESEPIFQALGRWAARSPLHDPTLPISAVSFLLSLRTMLDPGRAAGLRARIGFRLGEEAFLGQLAEDRIEIAAGPRRLPSWCCPARRRCWPRRSMAACRSRHWRPRALSKSRATGPWPRASSRFSPSGQGLTAPRALKADRSGGHLTNPPLAAGPRSG
ncbi:winged helix-turn-helix transcriptional regulator [Dankookia sp. P2]|uniref:winged helix-turn-helix transcriptional regulator n=1 Tax=Dankookia sp. P2 TaxID=3423955 RepID=UPI003D66CA01